MFKNIPFKNIYQIVKEKRIQSISIDIFDTLLLRKIHPEICQFYKYSHLFIKELKKYEIECSPEFWTMGRYYFRKINDEYLVKENNLFLKDEKNDPESNIYEIFESILNFLIKVNKPKILNPEDLKKKLLKKFIEIELEIEKKELLPNVELLEFLINIKKEKPFIKLFYLSDTYFNSKLINCLLNHFNIQILDGGYTSSEIRLGKYSKKLFLFLFKKNKLFSIHHLHLGDNKISDFKVPKSLGVNCILIKRYDLTENIKRYITFFSIENKLQKKFKNFVLKIKNKKNLEINQKYVKLINSVILIILAFINKIISYYSVLEKKVALYGISSEALYLKALINALDPTIKIETLSNINRKNLLKIILFKILNDKKIINKVEEIKNIINFYSQIMPKINDVYDYFGIKKVSFFSNEKFVNLNDEQIFKIIEEIKRNKITKEKINKTEKKLINEIKKLRSEKINIFIDLGWSGTIHYLFQKYLEISKKENIKIETWFMASTGKYVNNKLHDDNIKGLLINKQKEFDEYFILAEDLEEFWESLFKNDNIFLKNFFSYLRAKLINFIKENRNILKEIPPDFLKKFILKETFSSFKFPEKENIELLSNIYHEEEILLKKIKKTPILDIFLNKKKILFYLFLQPEKFKEIFRFQYYKIGFLNYYFNFFPKFIRNFLINIYLNRIKKHLIKH